MNDEQIAIKLANLIYTGITFGVLIAGVILLFTYHHEVGDIKALMIIMVGLLLGISNKLYKLTNK